MEEKRPKVTDVNPHLLCVLCGGYFVDATAIIECLHTFCRTCIVSYLQVHKYCPICDVLVHNTKPILNLRPDEILQTLVYKMIPDLYKKEMAMKRSFYSMYNQNLCSTDLVKKGEIELMANSKIFVPEETVTLSLEYVEDSPRKSIKLSSSKRYLRCLAAVTVSTLKKLIKCKYNISPDDDIHIFYDGTLLPHNLKLLDVAYMSKWNRADAIQIHYKIVTHHRIKNRKRKIENENQTKCEKEGTVNDREIETKKKLEIQSSNEINKTDLKCVSTVTSVLNDCIPTPSIKHVAGVSTASPAIILKHQEEKKMIIKNENEQSERARKIMIAAIKPIKENSPVKITKYIPPRIEPKKTPLAIFPSPAISQDLRRFSPLKPRFHISRLLDHTTLPPPLYTNGLEGRITKSAHRLGHTIISSPFARQSLYPPSIHTIENGQIALNRMRAMTQLCPSLHSSTGFPMSAIFRPYGKKTTPIIQELPSPPVTKVTVSNLKTKICTKKENENSKKLQNNFTVSNLLSGGLCDGKGGGTKVEICINNNNNNNEKQKTDVVENNTNDFRNIELLSKTETKEKKT